MRRVVAASVLASLLTGAGGALAAAPPEMPVFSVARDDVSVMLWLRRNTSLRPGQSVVFSEDNVLVIASDTVDAGRPAIHRVSFRQEATKLDFVSRTGGRSIRGSADVDCVTGKVKAQAIALYSGQDLKGDQILSQGPDLDWRAPVYGTASALVVQEVCAAKRPPANQIATAPPITRPPPIPTPPPSPPPRPPIPAPEPPPAPSAPPAPPAPRPPPIPVAPPSPLPPPAPRPAESQTVAQIGAFGSRAAAEGAWSKLSETYPAILAGKTVRIEPAIVSGAEVFRTSIQGFGSEADARSACAELMARSQACFVRKLP